VNLQHAPEKEEDVPLESLRADPMPGLHRVATKKPKLAQVWVGNDIWAYCCDGTDSIHHPLDNINGTAPCLHRIDGVLGATESSS
jgi:hypothetical protein